MMKRSKRIAAYAVIAAGVVAGFLLTPWGLPVRNRIPLQVVAVSGHCMEPTLRNGNVLIAVRGEPEPGRIIIARLPDGILVKRVHWSGGESGQFCGEELEEEGRTPWQRGQR